MKLELNEARLKELEIYLDDDSDTKSKMERKGSQSSNISILPDWMSKAQIFMIAIIVLTSLFAIVFWAIYPYIKFGETKTNVVNGTGTKTLEESTGFRTLILYLHSLINASIFLAPFFIWYFNNKCKISGFSQKDLPYSQRSLYYSYSINEGIIYIIYFISFVVSISKLFLTII